MADSKTATNEVAATKDKPTLKMVQIPTTEMVTRLEETAKAQGVSVNRYITNLIAKEFGLTVPEPKRRTAPLRAVFEAQYPRNEGESDADYQTRFEAFKTQQVKEANAKRAERTKAAVSFMEQVKAAAENGKLDEVNIAELLAQLKA